MENPRVDRKREQEEEEAVARSAIGPHVVYEAILVEGLEEIKRPNSALAFSGLAAGLSMGFSLVAQALLLQALPDTAWRPLISKLGYCAGFLMVILGRQQLFTENTLTPVLPWLKYKTGAVLLNLLRLWGIVLFANLAGTAIFAYAIMDTSIFGESTRAAFLEVGRTAMGLGFGTVLLRAIIAGWLIALMVWMLPFAEASRIWVVASMTYLIGLGHLNHIIAGSVDVLCLVAAGENSWWDYFQQFAFPTLLGNIIGGVALVAALNHGQVSDTVS